MLAFCTRCWSQISAQAKVCSECGGRVDDDPRSFEQKLLNALAHPLPATRARICWVLGQKRAKWAVPHLIGMLSDKDLYVRIAALRALGETADESAVPALERAAAQENVMVRIVAQGALEQIRTRQSV
jgi:HEAT repeat protein